MTKPGVYSNLARGIEPAVRILAEWVVQHNSVVYILAGRVIQHDSGVHIMPG